MAEEANVDESITAEPKARNEIEIDIKDEQNTKDYEETMEIGIGNINKIENRNKVCTKQWRIICKEIQPESLKAN